VSEAQAEERARQRRSREQAEGLVLDYRQSGLTRVAFCRLHGLSVATLDKYRKLHPVEGLREGDAARQALSLLSLVAVDPVEAESVPSGLQARPRLFVELASGRRIGVAPGFDPTTLRQLIEVLEPALNWKVEAHPGGQGCGSTYNSPHSEISS
jgi:transposase-like protein